MATSVHRVSGFAPVVGRSPRVLVLGSMPGVASLRAGEYYALPRNAFWPIMGALFDAGPDLPYAERLIRLTSHGIAVWDVLRHCERPGSLDSAINERTAQANDFAGFFRRHRSIRRVFFNGAKAADLYRRRALPDVQLVAPYLDHTRLPSTSPAMASMGFADKLAAWQVLSKAAR